MKLCSMFVGILCRSAAAKVLFKLPPRLLVGGNRGLFAYDLNVVTSKVFLCVLLWLRSMVAAQRLFLFFYFFYESIGCHGSDRSDGTGVVIGSGDD